MQYFEADFLWKFWDGGAITGSVLVTNKIVQDQTTPRGAV